MKTAIIGGGAAGFFCAINLAEMMPKADITIFERQARPLRKVEISGGGRCNCTNTFEGVTDLQHVYPRGARLMGRLFRQFSPQDAYRWFESHGVPLTVQPDRRLSQIIDRHCFRQLDEFRAKQQQKAQ